MNASNHTINPSQEDLIMLKKPENPPEGGLVSCKVCLKEIPRSVAKSQEGSDYVHYFCGDRCYVEWSKDQAEDRQPGSKSGQ